MNVGEPVGRTPEKPSEEFTEQVKHALENLYDFTYLQSSPLAGHLVTPTQSGEASGQNLRRQLIEGIEVLNPGPGIPFRAPNARLYNLLYLHYIEGMTVQEAAYELGVSARQAYRDLRRGENGVAAFLWSQRSSLATEEPRIGDVSSIQAELDRLDARFHTADVRQLVHHACRSVDQLAQKRAVELKIQMPNEPVTVSTDIAIARQVLVSLISLVVQQSIADQLLIELSANRSQVSLHLIYQARSDEPIAIKPASMISQLTARLGWTIKPQTQPDGRQRLTLDLTESGPIILVVDDNKNLVELLDRYLTGHHCQVVAASNGQIGLKLARDLKPDAIILDVMMPGMDGWEVLQTLRLQPQTSSIPIIVCSVFDDPELAYSLNVSHFLPKPISRDQILRALREVGVL